MYQYKISLLKSKIAEEEVQFKNSQDVAENSFIHSLFTDQDNDKEKLYVIILNIKNKVIGYSLISMGSLTASIVHPREVLKPAILASAASIMIIHNHPSGDPEPSTDYGN
jgi:DNA repair protein RadC